MAWMAVAEAAATLGVSERTIWRRIKSKAIEARGENGRTLVELSFGEDNNESVRQLSNVAAAQLSMRKLDADNVAEVLAVLSDYRASFDKQIAVTRRTARWLTALVFFLAVALGAGAWFHFEESSRLAGEHHDAIGEYRDDITEMQDSLAVAQSAHHKETAVLRGDIAVLKEKFGLAEGMSSARLDELVALKDESAKRAEKLGGQLAEQTKAFERMTAKQEEQLAKRAEDIRKMNQQAGVLKEDLQQARFLSDARLSRTDKVTEFIRRSAARSIGYAEGMRQHLVYRDRMENRLRRELAQLHSLKGEPADSTNHRAGIWSSTVDDDEAEASTLEDGDVSIGTIFKDCFNTWLFGRDDVSAFASASSKTANAKP